MITIKSKKILAYCLSKLAKIPLAGLPTAYLFRLLLTALCLLVFTTEINPTIRYVSPTGNNIPPYLTWEDAANSIQDAINVCEAGDTVLVDNGTYYENLVINTPISLIGLSMDSTVIDGRGLGDFTISVYAVFIIENFNIMGKGNGIGDAAIRNFQALNLLSIKSCKIQEARIGIGWVSILSTSLFVAENLHLNNLTRGFGISGEGNNYILDCVMVLQNEGATGISIGFSPSGDYYITNNIILFTGTSFLEKGIFIDRPRKVFISDNIINGFGNNIDVDINIESAVIRNNVLLNSKGSSVSSINDDALIENVIIKDGGIGIWGAPIQSDYNIFWGNQLNYGNFANPGDSDKVADPMFVKDTLPTPVGNYDYRLQAYSPAIDAGNPDILDVDSSRSDIGLYIGGTYRYIDLPPRPPVNLSAVLDTNQILLKWNRNSEADTSHYNVYRDTVSNFTIDSTKLVSSQTDTFYFQYPPYQSSRYVYKITCVDNQGNESQPSEEIIIDVTSLTTNGYPMTISDYLLYQNYPNPFNPSTKIEYKLKDRGYVKLMVYDITGALVSVLVNKEQEAGYYEIEFNVGNGLPSVPNNLASGIYLYRIEVIGEGRIPKFSDMKKMVFIK